MLMRWIGVGVVGLALGCSSSATGTGPGAGLHFTDEYDAAALSGSYGAFADGKSLSVFVAYTHDGFLRVRDGKDAITVDVNGTAAPAPEVIEGTKVHYEPVVTPPPDVPVVTITFRRGAGTVLAKQTLGPSFELVGPPANIHFGDVVTLDVTPRPDLSKYQSPLGPTLTHSLEVSGSCVSSGYQKLPLTTPPGGYPLKWDTRTLVLDGAVGCEIDVKLRMDASPVPLESHGLSLQGATFEAAQHRSFHATLAR
jgi:hypothetical protein